MQAVHLYLDLFSSTDKRLVNHVGCCFKSMLDHKLLPMTLCGVHQNVQWGVCVCVWGGGGMRISPFSLPNRVKYMFCCIVLLCLGAHAHSGIR